MRTPGQYLALAATVLLAACATEPASTSTSTEAAAPSMVCTQERPIGSNIAVTKCRTAEQIEKERNASQGILDPGRQGRSMTKQPGS